MISIRSALYSAFVVTVIGCASSSAPGTLDEQEVVASSASALTPAVYNFGSIVAPGKCIDVAANATNDGANVQQWACVGSGGQAWRAEDAGGGFTRFVNVPSGKCLDVAGNNPNDGANVQLWTCNGSTAQRFRVENSGAGLRFVGANGGKCVDVGGWGTHDGANILMWSCHGGINQQFNPAIVDGWGGGTGGSTNGGGTGGNGGGNGDYKFVNKCAQTVWVGALNAQSQYTLPANGGFRLDAGKSQTINLPLAWSGRFWGRTGCNNDGAFCATGDCARGTQCGGAGGIPPASLIELTTVADGQDFYDISLVDGYNLPVRIAPTKYTRSDVNNPYDCGVPGCISDLNNTCAPELQKKDASGRVVACLSACERFGTDAYCCRGANGTPATCPPSGYSRTVKAACPTAYSYAYDDTTSTYTCRADAWEITFCP